MYKNEKGFMQLCETTLNKIFEIINDTPESDRVPNWWQNMSQKNQPNY